MRASQAVLLAAVKGQPLRPIFRRKVRLQTHGSQFQWGLREVQLFGDPYCAVNHSLAKPFMIGVRFQFVVGSLVETSCVPV
jgi:hypothetical protein